MDSLVEMLVEIITAVTHLNQEGVSTADLFASLPAAAKTQVDSVGKLSELLRSRPGDFRSLRGRWLLADGKPGVAAESEQLSLVGSFAAVSSRLALNSILRERMTGRRLVAEVGLDAALFDEVEDVVKREVDFGVHASRIASGTPHLFVTYLVGHGVYHYDKGNFWGADTGNLFDQSAGPHFASALRELRLETFEDMVFDDNALRYVGPILAHGGIPKFCLDDFFAMLVRDAGKVDGGARDLLSHWRSRKTSFFGIDAPVRRFLLFGGDLAVDFLDRCLDLLAEHREGRAPSSTDVGLPPYVVLGFRKYVSRAPLSRGTDSGRVRVGRPVVRIDPWSPNGPEVELPPVPRELHGAFWRVQAGSGPQRVEASHGETRRVALSPSRSWDVELHQDARVSRAWTFEGLDPDSALALFFNPADGALLPLAATLRAESAWVLRPETVEVRGIEVDGTERELALVEEFPSPGGNWSGYSLTDVSLVGLRAISIQEQNSSRSRRIGIRPPAERPRLVGNRLDQVVTDRGLAVFDAAPELALPGDPTDGVNWSVRLRTNGEWRPLTVAELEVGEHGLRIDSAFQSDEITEIDLVVNGPLGSDLRESFVVVPGLQVVRPRQLLLPGEPGAVRAHALALRIDGNDAGQTCEMNVRHAQGEVDFVAADAAGHEVALRVRVAKVLWGARFASGGAQSLAEDPLRWSADDLATGGIVALTVRTGQSDVSLRLALCSDRETLQMSAEARTSSTGRWLFDLGAFSDTVRTTDAPILELRLRVGIRTIVVAAIRPTFEAAIREVTSRAVDDFTCVTVRFHEVRPLRNRVARLWSLDRPWTRPIVESIDDAEREVVELKGFDCIPVGDYRLELAIDDGWTTPARPHANQPGVARVTIGTSDEINHRLDRLNPDDPFAVLEGAVRRGFVRRRLDLGEIIKVADAALASLLVVAEEADARQILSTRFRTPAGLLMCSPEGFARACVDAHDAGVCGDLELTRLAIALGGTLHACRAGEVPETVIRALWGLAPALAAALDYSTTQSAVVNTEAELARADRAGEYLGSNREDGPEPLATGEPVDQLWIGIGDAALREIQRLSDLIPAQILSEDALVAANFEWLMAAKTGRGDAIRRWWDEHRRCADMWPDLPAATAHFVARMPPPGTEAWAGIPRATLGAAFELVLDGQQSIAAMDALLTAFDFAPRLVTRDLVLARVLTQGRVPARPLDAR